MKIHLFSLISLCGFLVYGEQDALKLEPFEVKLSDYYDDMHPVPEGFEREEYYSKEWQITQPYTFEFTGECYHERPIFTFIFNEPSSHAFPGFELEGDLFFPRYLGFIEHKNGEWLEVEIGYCGTGDQSFILEPKRKYKVVLSYLQQGENIQRIILKGPRGMKFVSEPIDISEIKKSFE